MAGAGGGVDVIRAGAALALLVLGGAAAPDPARKLAGRYDREFPDGTVTGDGYTGRDIVEIVPVAANAAYVRLHLDFYNGHTCSLAGVAQARGDALVYREAQDAAHTGGAPCTLTVRRDGATLAWSDPANGCKAHCGMRGSFLDGAVPWSSRRPITYMARLKGSREYKAALAGWRTGTSAP